MKLSRIGAVGCMLVCFALFSACSGTKKDVNSYQNIKDVNETMVKSVSTMDDSTQNLAKQNKARIPKCREFETSDVLKSALKPQTKYLCESEEKLDLSSTKYIKCFDTGAHAVVTPFDECTLVLVK